MDWAKRTAKKFFLFWTDFGTAYNVGYGILVPLGWLGLWLARGNRLKWILHGLLAYVLSICLVVYANERMRYAIEPVLVIAASAAVVWFVERTRKPALWLSCMVVWSGVHFWIAHSWTHISSIVSIL